MMKTLQALWSAFVGGTTLLRNAGHLISKLALAGIVFTYSFEVINRYLLNAPTAWSADIVSYLLCVVVFTMMPYITATGGQVAVTVVIDTLPVNRREYAMRVIYVIGFACCAAMAYFASGETARQIIRNIHMLAAYPVPKWWISIWIAIGFGLCACEYLRLALVGPSGQPPEAASTVREA